MSHSCRSTDQMCGLRKTTTKPLPTSSESRGRSDAKHGGSSETKFKKPSGGGPFRQAHAMVVQEGNSGATRFPPPAVWDHTALWAHPCIMGMECSGAHSPASCLKFKRLTPKARLMLVQSKELCQLQTLGQQQMLVTRQGAQLRSTGVWGGPPLLAP